MKHIITGFAIIGLVLSGIFLMPSLVVAQQTALNASIVAPTEGQVLIVGQPFTFSGLATGGNAIFYSYLWNFGDGSFGAGATFDKTYTVAGPKTVTLTVTDHDGTQASASRNIVVNSNTEPTLPTADLQVNSSNGPITVNQGISANLSWTSSNTTACTASGAWTGSKATSGSESTGAFNTVGTFTYTLTCTGASGSVSDSVTINVQTGGGGGGNAPVISNITVDGITQTSAVIHWTTDILADSRVIYDTVSHSTLGSAPNFGYAFSTLITDTNPKVTAHIVTLTGLSPNTQYFFRVLSQS